MTADRTIDQIAGTAIPLRGDNIDTDRIIPARYLKAVTFEGLGVHVFEDDRSSMPGHPFASPRYQGAAILLASANFGSGSSREHAPQALKRWGIQACVAESFSDIFRGNSLAIGLPCFTATAADIELALRFVEDDPRLRVRVSVSDLEARLDDKTLTLEMPPGMQDAFLSGHWDATGLLLERFEEVRTVASNLPYIAGF